MTAQFDAADFARLQAAHDEIIEFGEFLKDRFVTLAELTGQKPIRRETVTVPRPMLAGEPLNQPGAGPHFHVRECLGGDRFSTDYRDHYMPVDFALGGADADENLRKQFAQFQRLAATFADPTNSYGR